jgi:hypothetical protein
MKKLPYLLLLLMLTVAACGKKADESPEAKFKGKWEITTAEGYMADLNKGTTYEFADKNVTITKGISTEATWTLKGDTLQLVYQNMDTPFNFNYAFEGEKLVLKMNNADAKYSQKFTLEKK